MNPNSSLSGSAFSISPVVKHRLKYLLYSRMWVNSRHSLLADRTASEVRSGVR